MKKCIKCDMPKKIDDFYRHPNTRDGRSSICKECHKKKTAIRNDGMFTHDRNLITI